MHLKDAVSDVISLDRKGENLNQAYILSIGSVLNELETDDGSRSFYEIISKAVRLDCRGVINRAYILSLGSILKKLGTEGNCSFYEDVFEIEFFAQSFFFYKV